MSKGQLDTGKSKSVFLFVFGIQTVMRMIVLSNSALLLTQTLIILFFLSDRLKVLFVRETNPTNQKLTLWVGGQLIIKSQGISFWQVGDETQKSTFLRNTFKHLSVCSLFRLWHTRPMLAVGQCWSRQWASAHQLVFPFTKAQNIQACWLSAVIFAVCWSAAGDMRRRNNWPSVLWCQFGESGTWLILNQHFLQFFVIESWWCSPLFHSLFGLFGRSTYWWFKDFSCRFWFISKWAFQSIIFIRSVTLKWCLPLHLRVQVHYWRLEENLWTGHSS